MTKRKREFATKMKIDKETKRHKEQTTQKGMVFSKKKN